MGFPVDSGSKDVATAATAEALASQTKVQMVTIRAKKTNTGNLYVGSPDVSSSKPALAAGEIVTFAASQGVMIDLSTIWLDVDTNGEGADFWYNG